MQQTLKLPDELYDRAQDLVRANPGMTFHQVLVAAVHVGLAIFKREDGHAILSAARLDVLDMRVKP
jgi:hypothetical protein